MSMFKSLPLRHKVFNKSFRVNENRFSVDNVIASEIYILELEYNNNKFRQSGYFLILSNKCEVVT
jgi:hypothetical protein